MKRERRQRIAAYNVCVDDRERLLLCRLGAITDRPGSWTLPGGGIEFGEHPAAAARRELREETGLDGRIVELLAVDSACRVVDGEGNGHEYHSVRIVYRTEIIEPAVELRHEVDGSTDRAGWFARADIEALQLVDVGRLGARLAFGDAGIVNEERPTC